MIFIKLYQTLSNFIKRLYYFIVSLIFRFIPRDKHLWLTGLSRWAYEDMFHAPEFFDNSKYFFLYLVKHTDEKAYWLSATKQEYDLLKSYGLPVVKLRSLKGIYMILRAGYFYHHYGSTTLNYKFQRGSVQINLWHGTALKKVGRDAYPAKPEPPKRFLLDDIAAFLNKGTQIYVASTTRYVSEKIYTSAFNLPLDHCLEFGYPRTDVLKLNKNEALDFCEHYSRELLPYIDFSQAHSKTLLYMPTWRDDDPDYFSKINIDFDELNERLKKIDAAFFLKLHPLTKFVDIRDKYSNIMQIKNDSDIYPFLIFTDYLITDYSSIYFDFLPLDREIIFIPYDKEYYIRTRELYFDYDEVTPGVKYNTFEEFMDNLPNLDTLNYKADRERIRNLFVGEHYAFDASEKIYNFLKSV